MHRLPSSRMSTRTRWCGSPHRRAWMAPSRRGTPPPPIYAQAGIVSLGILGGLAAFLSWTEPGRHAIFGALFPLYTRLKKEEVLDHFVRGQVFGVIKAEPGTNFTEIRDDLGLSNGTLAYHLRTLEVE